MIVANGQFSLERTFKASEKVRQLLLRGTVLRVASVPCCIRRERQAAFSDLLLSVYMRALHQKFFDFSVQ
jgi:hypothetical protein